MSDPQPDDPRDRDLWRRFLRAARRPPAPPDACLDAGDLAAYADRKLRGDNLARVEAHLASCDRCLQAVREARELLREPAALAPPELVARAKALVPAEATPRTGATPGALRKLAGWVGLHGEGSRWKTVLRWGAAVAAAVLVGFAGFSAGSATYRSRQATDAKLVAEVSFDLAATAEDDLLLLGDDLELLLAAQGGAQ